MFENKLVAVINKQVEPGVAMNALAHMSLGFGAHVGSDKLHLMDYVDADANTYPSISKMPFIVLRAKNSNKILDLINQAKEKGIQYSVFTNTMTVGTWEDQEKRTKESKQEEIDFYGVILHGPTKVVAEMTKKFSLWK